MSAKRKVLALIKQTELKIKNNQERLHDHKHYFISFTQDHKMMLVAMLLPSFLAGWQSGKKSSNGLKLRPLAEFLFYTLWTNLQKYHKLL